MWRVQRLSDDELVRLHEGGESFARLGRRDGRSAEALRKRYLKLTASDVGGEVEAQAERAAARTPAAVRVDGQDGDEEIDTSRVREQIPMDVELRALYDGFRAHLGYEGDFGTWVREVIYDWCRMSGVRLAVVLDGAELSAGGI